jgi:hypothetical protein
VRRTAREIAGCELITHSGYKGVSRMRTKWCAAIAINGKRKYLGTFATKEAAAAAYRKATEEARLTLTAA